MSPNDQDKGVGLHALAFLAILVIPFAAIMWLGGGLHPNSGTCPTHNCSNNQTHITKVH